MNIRLAAVLVVLLFCTGIVVYMVILSGGEDPRSDQSFLSPLPQSPLDAGYSIEGTEVTLMNGTASFEAAPGSAGMVRVAVVGEPVYGDLNDDGTDDVALLFTYDGGGSGTFYYVAAALRDGDGYLGSNALLLGDRIGPQNVVVRQGMLIANYADRATDTPMTEEPHMEVAKYFTVTGAMLSEVVLGDGERVYAGELSYRDEVLAFTPCGGTSMELLPESRSYAALKAVYEQRAADLADGSAVFVVVVGARSGVDGEAEAIFVNRIVSAPRGGECGNQESDIQNHEEGYDQILNS